MEQMVTCAFCTFIGFSFDNMLKVTIGIFILNLNKFY